jgi:SAM-dependent methyltransferase
MNIPDKAGVFREVARVLKSGARFAIFDIMHGSGAFEFPVPWAQTRETNFAASLGEYRSDLEAAGFRIEHERNRTQFAIDFMQRMAAEKPVLGVHVLMGEQAPLMLKNVMTAIGSSALQPFEIIAVAN